MHIQEAIEWIHSRLSFGIKPGLKRMEWFMEQLGHPEKKLKAIHIAGTNGKGSTLSYLRNILENHGFQVGTFTSPYIVQFNERISLNGTPIQDEDLVYHVNRIKPLCEELENTSLGPATEFEVITAMAFDYFASQNIDYVIFETGLGGRLDSTNIVNPLLTIITNVGKDHMHILGETYEQIAREKAGIIKKGIPLITAADQKDARRVILNKANEQHATVYEFGHDFSAHDHYLNKGMETFTFSSMLGQLPDIEISMKGTHQVTNASLAIQAFLLLSRMEHIHVDPSLVKNGLKDTKWPGRFEVIQEHPTIVLDGAHNEEGLLTLVDTLTRYYPEQNRHLVFTALKDKPITRMLRILEDHFDSVRLTTFDFPRSISPMDLYQQCSSKNKYRYDDWTKAIEDSLKSASRDDIIVITGSLYFISEVRNFFDRIKGLC